MTKTYYEPQEGVRVMTREEAINKWIVPAIKNTWNEKKCVEIIQVLEQEICEDCISRKSAKEIVDYYIQFYDGQFRINESIDKLPSVQPIRSKGTWTLEYGRFECQVCHCRENKVSDFCPNCGADMRGNNENIL